jgi:hypothetical protein
MSGYTSSRHGFELGRIYWDDIGPFIPHEAKWREHHVTDYRVVEHDLQVNAWVMAYRRLAQWVVTDWLGPDQDRLEVPKRYADRRYRPIGLEEANFEIPDYTHSADLRLKDFAPVVPDATLSLYVEESDREFDLMVEFDRTRRPVKNVDKLRRYDALVTAWWRLHDRYRGAKEPPAVLCVCPDEDAVFGLMRAADRELTGRLVTPGQRPDEWPAPGRARTLFAAERDVHEGSRRAWMLPRLPLVGNEPREFFARETRLLGDAE